MTEEDIIFTAGLFLGEGSARVYLNDCAGFSGFVGVSQLDREPLDKLQHLWGGGIYLNTDKGKPITWQWTRNGTLALPCLEAILPVMRGWSAFSVERIEMYVRFWAIPSAGRHERLRIVAWFQTNVEKHKKACHVKLEEAWLLRKEKK